MLFRARESHDCWDVAKEMMDHIGNAERESKCICSSERSNQKTNSIAAYGQRKTHVLCHDCGVMQGSAHSHISVISHGGQKVTFHSGKECKEEHLSSTGAKGDDIVFYAQASQNLRSDC